MRIINAAEAAREATEQLLASSKEYIVIGEGVPDPMACFGTTKGLKEKFPGQVFDAPISENGVTGVCIGAAIGGLKPIQIHMRQDFLLYAMDQIVNNAAKWHSMFGGNGGNVPMVIKAFTGRGWGAGHQHSQNLESLFAHIPGLKVVCPSSARNAKGLMIAAARDPNPVMILEHRWIHHLTSDVPEEMYETPIGKAEVYGDCKDMVVFTWGQLVSEALKARSVVGDSLSVVDLQSLSPMDAETISWAAAQGKRLYIVCDSWLDGIANQVRRNMNTTKGVGIHWSPPCYPSSTPALTKNYYPNFEHILTHALGAVPRGHESETPHDIPDKSFTGPF